MSSGCHCLSSIRGDRIINNEMRKNLENLSCCKDCMEPGEKKKVLYGSSKGGCCPRKLRKGKVSVEAYQGKDHRITEKFRFERTSTFHPVQRSRAHFKVRPRA